MFGLEDPDLFDTGPERDFDALTGLAARLTKAPVALFSLVDGRRQFFKSAVGMAEPWASLGGTPISHSFCAHVATTGETLEIGDARADPLVRDNPAITDLGVAAYLGEPVRGPSGRVLGALCVIDHKPREWRARDRSILDTLARSAENAVALRASTGALARLMGDMLGAKAALTAQTAELAIARTAAEQALARQTRFLGGLSHELRTPLNGVLGGLSLLETAADPDAATRFRAMIRAAAHALADCVDDLITYSRVGAGLDAPEVAPVDPRAIVAAASGAVAALAAERALRVETLVDPAVPARWTCDGRAVELILVNLLGNAIKYTHAGHVGVSVRRWGAALAFRVEDSGRGVPEALHETIFEPFNRGDPASARSAAGTGLGLAIARQMATRLGGSLRLERSAPGKGACFLLMAPDASGALEDEADLAAAI